MYRFRCGKNQFNMTTEDIIRLALEEDIGDGDHTTQATIPKQLSGRARLLIKENGVLCGVDLAATIFRMVDPSLVFKKFITDGTEVVRGDIAFEVEGSRSSILQAERLVLNFIQRLSGIATSTRQMVRKLEGMRTTILDTRKTTPLLRDLEKYAVRTGGGSNHRFGLYDMIMIKDNHVDYAGGIVKAIDATEAYLKATGKDLKIEIEVRNFTELDQVLEHGKVHRIMLDNFSAADLKKAVELIGGRYETEASGGITGDTIAEYASTGVDYLSMGALTHQIRSLDMSLKAVDR